MFEDDSIIKTCIVNGITVQQYFFLYLLYKNDHCKEENASLFKQYVKKFGPIIPYEMLTDLIDKGFIEDFNSDHRNIKPELFMILDEIKHKLFAVPEVEGEDFYNTYPAYFPIGDSGKMFMARSGAPKDIVISFYMDRITKTTHPFVMKQLKKFIKLVEEGTLPGRKIMDFIGEELWHQLPNDEEDGGTEIPLPKDFSEDV